MMKNITMSLLPFLACMTVTPRAFAQKSSNAPKTPLARIVEYARKQNKFVVAELTEETHKALTTPVVKRETQAWEANDVQAFFNKEAEKTPRTVVLTPLSTPYAPAFLMGAAFQRDFAYLGRIRDLLTSFTPEQWKGLEESGYNYPASSLTEAQKDLLHTFVGRITGNPKPDNITYELDFRTWIAVGGAGQPGTVRLVGGTVTPQ